MATTRRQPAAKVALKLSSLTISERISLADAIATALTGNPHFGTPPITPKVLQAGSTSLTKAEAAAKAAKQLAAIRMSERDDAVFTLDNMLTQLASYVQTQANGNKNIIDSAAMPVKGASVRTTTPPIAPDPLAATSGAKAGEAKLKWAAAPGAKSYVIERAQDPNNSQGWTHTGASTRRTFVVQNVPAGRWWFRVAGINGKGQGTFTDPATCIVS